MALFMFVSLGCKLIFFPFLTNLVMICAISFTSSSNIYYDKVGRENVLPCSVTVFEA